MKKLLIAVCLVAVAVTATADRRGMMARNATAGASPASAPDIFWWKLNEGSGTSITGDASNGGDDGTTDGTWVTGASGSGSALDFNGTTQDAATSSAITYGTNRITISFWLNCNPVDSRMILESSANINSADGAFYVYKVGAAQIEATAKNGTGYRAERFNIPTNAWSHVMLAWDGSSTAGDWEGWTNGVHSVTVSTNTSTRTAADPMNAYVLYAGARGASSLFFDGSLDDIRIYTGTNIISSLSTIYADPQ